jgi:branched-subunit amino acid aminotransferase/4-amino-4-deoxychorismate lyase
VVYSPPASDAATRYNRQMPGPPLAVLDGQVMSADEAMVPVTDPGLLRGDGVFEVIRVYGGRPFALDDHLRRLERSAENLRLPIDLDALRTDTRELLRAAGAEDGALRLLVTRGGRRIGLLEPLPVTAHPISLACVEYVAPRVLDGVKSLSYAGNMRAARLAREAGAEDALLVSPHGRVLEGTTSTLFASLDGRTLVTPPLSDRVLDSITRRRLLALLPEAREELLSRDQLDGAHEAFLASTLREVQAIRSIDAIILPTAPGPLTRGAAAAFRAHVVSELAGRAA